MDLRQPYKYDRDALSKKTAFRSVGPTRTQQNFKDECDINNILRKFAVTGQMAPPSRLPTYGDFTGVVDYKTAVEAVLGASEAFYQLPADVRSFFANDPAAFVDFCSDESNRDKAIELGLLAAGEASAKPVPLSEVGAAQAAMGEQGA